MVSLMLMMINAELPASIDPLAADCPSFLRRSLPEEVGSRVGCFLGGPSVSSELDQGLRYRE